MRKYLLATAAVLALLYQSGCSTASPAGRVSPAAQQALREHGLRVGENGQLP